ADALRLEVGTHVGVTTVYPSMVASPIHDTTRAAGLSLDGVSRPEPVEGVVDAVVAAATAPRLVIAAHMEHGTVPRDEVEALVDEVLMPLFTAGGGGNVPGPEERSTMGA
ncbi:hypothetical protein ADL27_25315, partial [Streptomyces sp. NRRL F-6602]